ncbi:MAG: FkbM family methyltransferase [Alphaproteobacteria bacterium]|nr:FkbM family methyltransferase [Alphaproteobacteria bacterium]
MTKPLPYSVVVPTVYGQMIVNKNDKNQTNTLFKTGQSPDHFEIVLLSHVIRIFKNDRVFFDVGANFGAFSLAMSRYVGEKGKVYAFEAQRILYNMFCGSIALNSIENIHAFNMAVSDACGSIEVPQFDYTKALNFGSIEFGAEQKEVLSQERGHDPERVERVSTISLDSLQGLSVNLIKIDVEGMEMEVLAGAEKIITQCQPVLFIEVMKIDKERIRKYLFERGYSYIPVQENFLCIPQYMKEFEGPWKTLETPLVSE